ncbi:metal-binding protein [Roseivivax isoporae LMG 25204]|uniref:Metal-binding protein n=1 Tax=Roseivivax isoporae LMG 25204 TaxID=1449351 RepID=X7FBG9_9RHOB|nr:metal-binding protein [Roseivivax isoporae LMG 25204]
MVPRGDEERAPATLHDTFDGALAAAGLLLVAAGDGLWLVGLPEGPVHQADAEPGFVQDMNEGPVTAALRPRVPALRRLIPVADATLARQAMALIDDEGKTLVRVAVCAVSTGHGSATVLTLSPLRGYDRPHARLRAALDPLGDPEAALTALRPPAMRYTAKPPVDIAADMPARKAATLLARTHLSVARANERGIVADHDTEFLHDYRVNLRKVRSVVSLFTGVWSEKDTTRLKDRFRALMAPTGPLRDLDVHLLDRDRYMEMVPEALRPGIVALFDDFAKERAAAQAALARHLESDDYAREAAALEALLASAKRLKPGPAADVPVAPFAQDLIWSRYRKVCKRAARIDDATPDEEVHALRIHCKKLRYLMEFFAPVFGPSEVKPLVKALKGLQDTLGAFNDAAVQQDALRAVLERLPRRGAARIEIATSIGALLTVLAQRQAEGRARVASSFAAFDSPETRAGFADLFHRGKEAA